MCLLLSLITGLQAVTQKHVLFNRHRSMLFRDVLCGQSDDQRAFYNLKQCLVVLLPLGVEF